jgi:hypothetical protein
MCERCIKLFGDTCGDLFEEPVAEAFRAKGMRIAESPKFALSSTCFRPVASTGASKGPGAQEQGAFLLHAAGLGWQLERLYYAFYVATREQEGREASEASLTAAIRYSDSSKGLHARPARL